MKMILPNCRNHLTAQDVEFILAVLGRGDKERKLLSEFLTDRVARDIILDNGKLLDAIQDQPESLRISCYLYFYLLVRHSLKHLALNDEEVADYVAELLAEFSQEARRVRPIPGDSRAFEYLVDMIQARVACRDDERFLLRAHLGNYALFMTGLFWERIAYKERTHGAPGIDYYERIGSDSFQEASRDHLAEEFGVSSVLERLAQGFHHVRLALNDMTQRFLAIRPPGWDIPPLPAG